MTRKHTAPHMPSTIPWIIHIDMDAFYASVEQMDNPELRGKPIGIGTDCTRGVLSAASYEARTFGVRSAMPSGMAKKLCPQLIFVPGRMRRYKEISEKVMSALQDFSPNIEQASIDEAYVDGQGLERLFGPIETLCQHMQRAIFDVTGGLTCSVGAAPKKFLAKIASDINKPHGIFVLPPEAVPDFLRTLPVQKIPGVGKKFMAELQKLGVKHAGDVYRFPEEFWERRFGKGGTQLWRRAHGEDSGQVTPYTEPKSESSETTFHEDTLDRAFLQKTLFAHAERVGASLRKQGFSGRTITLKVKFADFTQVTRSRTLPQSTQGTQCIFATACELLEALELPQKVRLIGLGVSGFHGGAEQGLLFQNASQEESTKHSKLDDTLDALRSKFGRSAIVRGRLFTPKDEQ